MQILNLKQGSNQWLALKRTVISSTDGAMVLNQKSWPRLKQSKAQPSTFKSPAMRRGNALEPKARAALERQTKLKYQPVCVFDETERMLASLDGLAFGRVATCEIKCPEKGVNSDLWKQAENNKIPHGYYVQTQVGLAVSGAPVCHYWVYDADLDKGIRIDVYPDFMMQCQLVEATRAYWAWEAEQGSTMPEKSAAHIAHDAEFASMEIEYLKLLAAKNQVEERLKALEEKLLAHHVPGVEVTQGSHVFLEKQEVTGSIDYKAALKKHAPFVDLEEFRRQPKDPYTVKIKLNDKAKSNLNQLKEISDESKAHYQDSNRAA